MVRKVPAINTSSLADVSFLLLTFFLLTSNISTEQGISENLPPPDANGVTLPIEKRNVLEIEVNFLDEVLVNGDIVPVDELKGKVKEFLLNPLNDNNLSEREMKMIDKIGEYPVSKGVISLLNDPHSTYNTFVQVREELRLAIKEIKNHVSLQYFGKKYELLDADSKMSVQEAVPLNIVEKRQANISDKE